MLDDSYLKTRLQALIKLYFSDLDLRCPLLIKFSRKNRYTVGSVRYFPKKKYSLIRINGHLKNPNLPKFLIDVVISHELCHLVHGFSSYQKPKYRHPHRGGIVSKELTVRGLAEVEQDFKNWMKTNWQQMISNSK